MTHKQLCIRFAHPCAIRTSSQWRQALLTAHPHLIEHVGIFQSRSALSLTAQTPEASARMRDGAVTLMRAVANIAGRMLDVEMLEFTPALAHTGYEWLYQVPRLVVARSGESWDVWREADLDDARMRQMCARIDADLSSQIRQWCGQTPDLQIEVVSAGAAMVLKDATAQGPRPMSVMARKEVIFSSTKRIEGAFWAGLLQATGHGRIYRAGYSNQD